MAGGCHLTIPSQLTVAFVIVVTVKSPSPLQQTVTQQFEHYLQGVCKIGGRKSSHVRQYIPTVHVYFVCSSFPEIYFSIFVQNKTKVDNYISFVIVFPDIYYLSSTK